MRVRVSSEYCTGHARCAIVAEAMFDLDDEGYNASRGSEFAVAPGQEDIARAAAEHCPERAIEILDDN